MSLCRKCPDIRRHFGAQASGGVFQYWGLRGRASTERPPCTEWPNRTRSPATGTYAARNSSLRLGDGRIVRGLVNSSRPCPPPAHRLPTLPHPSPPLSAHAPPETTRSNCTPPPSPAHRQRIDARQRIPVASPRTNVAPRRGGRHLHGHATVSSEAAA